MLPQWVCSRKALDKWYVQDRHEVGVVSAQGKVGYKEFLKSLVVPELTPEVIFNSLL